MGSWRRHPTAAGEVTRRILAAYEAGGLVTMCAWCRRVELDGEWFLAPRQAASGSSIRKSGIRSSWSRGEDDDEAMLNHSLIQGRRPHQA